MDDYDYHNYSHYGDYDDYDYEDYDYEDYDYEDYDYEKYDVWPELTLWQKIKQFIRKPIIWWREKTGYYDDIPF